MIYTGIIQTDRFSSLTGTPDVWDNRWSDVERDGITYKQITSFPHYFTQVVINQLDALFETEQEYQAWIESTDIVPTFLVVEHHTNHPHYPDYIRTATAVQMPAINFKKNSLAIALEVRTYDAAGTEQKQLYREVELIADNTTIVQDSLGNDIGEYDYIIGLMNQGVSIEQIIRNSIQNRSADGTIDSKLGLA
jgi:hypothetical protein